MCSCQGFAYDFSYTEKKANDLYEGAYSLIMLPALTIMLLASCAYDEMAGKIIYQSSVWS